MLPAIVMVTTPEEAFSFVERRALAARPTFGNDKSIEQQIIDLEAYLDDHFGFREDMIATHSWLSYFIFGVPADERVVASPDGSLFFFNQAYNGVTMLKDFHRGATPEIPLGMLELFRQDAEKKRDEMAAFGIDYVLVIAPEKQSIYPEHLPEAYAPIAGGTWLDQVLEHMYSHSDVKIIDMREELKAIAESEADPLYFPYGTHWNSDGAWVGYETVMGHLNFQIVEKEIFSSESSTSDTDLAEFSGLGRWLSTPDINYMFAVKSCAISLEEPEHHGSLKITPRRTDGRDFVYQRCDSAPNSETIAFFHNSYAIALEPFFTESFETTAYVWSSYDSDIAKRLASEIGPDIVIEQWVERTLMAYFAYRDFESLDAGDLD